MVACTSRRHGPPAPERGMRPHKQRGKGRGSQWISDRLGFWWHAGELIVTRVVRGGLREAVDEMNGTVWQPAPT